LELVTPDGDESSYGTGKAKIEGVYNTKEDAEKANSSGSSSSKRVRSTSTTPIVNYSPVYNISGDADHIFRTIRDNHHTFARHVHDSLSEHLSRQAVV
jgi:hypothetical protein